MEGLDRERREVIVARRRARHARHARRLDRAKTRAAHEAALTSSSDAERHLRLVIDEDELRVLRTKVARWRWMMPCVTRTSRPGAELGGLRYVDADRLRDQVEPIGRRNVRRFFWRPRAILATVAGWDIKVGPRPGAWLQLRTDDGNAASRHETSPYFADARPCGPRARRRTPSRRRCR